MATRPFAVFDIDGTIIRWQLYHAIGDELAKQGFIDADHFEKVRAARMNWKRRAGGEGFRAYETELVQAFTSALKDIDAKTLNAVADKVFDEYKDQVYTYSRDLIRDLKEKGYLLFAISGSPSVIVQKLADYYGFDDFAATTFLESEGRLTGEVDLSLGRKPELLKQLMKKYDTNFIGSIGVGDSEGDIDMLELVEQPIALNPSRQLYEHAKAKNWPIVLERKNMIYRLEAQDGTYILA